MGHGTTCHQIAKKIIYNKKLTVVTNNVNILYELSLYDHISLIITGGDIKASGHSLHVSGDFSLDLLSKLRINKAFISPSGAHLKCGYTISDRNQFQLYNKVCEISDELFLVIDNSKFDKTAMIPFLPIDVPIKIIANVIPEDYVKFYIDRKIQFVTN